MFDQTNMPWADPPNACRHEWRFYGYDQSDHRVFGCYHCPTAIRGNAAPEDQ